MLLFVEQHQQHNFASIPLCFDDVATAKTQINNTWNDDDISALRCSLANKRCISEERNERQKAIIAQQKYSLKILISTTQKNQIVCLLRLITHLEILTSVKSNSDKFIYYMKYFLKYIAIVKKIPSNYYMKYFFLRRRIQQQ